ncbi:MAG: phage terminase large subunit [Acidobacteria bacterium]|nr:phage terminase large subunit [Acidobacteriota bacterium]
MMPSDEDDEFMKWLEHTAPTLEWRHPHQRYLCGYLREITASRIRRSMIFMPPRHGKSEMVTIHYAAWRLIRDPRLNLIVACYNQQLANRFSRRIRRIVSVCVELAADKTAVDEWETKAGGGVRAVGVGAGVTGFGASLVIIDDPIKGRAEAESVRRRNTASEWFSDDIYTRLEPEAAIILIQTRWHEDDLAGRLLKEDEGSGHWRVIKLPAIAEDGDALGRRCGEALWPERFGIERLLDIKRQLGSYSFSALYQQSPVPRDGEMFKREWFTHIVAAAPKGLSWARGYDLAVSTRTTADHTASFRCAFGPDGTLYIADGFRRRIEYPEQRKFVIERLFAERDTMHGIEQALHGKALLQDLRRSQRSRASPLRAVRVDADKWTRALSWAPLAEAGKIALVQGGWIDEFIDEACAFPNGEHDDQIDAVSIAVRMLAERKRAMYAFRGDR